MNNSYCILAFKHLNINTDGKIFPCCSMSRDFSFGHINNTTINEAWNSPEANHIRKSIKQGNLPIECKGCIEDENVGIESDRMRANRTSKYWTSTDDNNSYISVNESLELRLSNVCNLACRICRPSASTSWYADAKFLGIDNKNYSGQITPTPNNTKLINEVTPLLRNLKRISFVGGEPLLHIDHYKILEELIDVGQSQNIRLEYVSNFTKLNFGKYSAIEIWKKFKNVNITISIDDTEKRFELLRKGACWQGLIDNINLIRKECPHITLSTSCSVSLHNIFNLLDIIETLQQLDFSGAQISLGIVREPTYYSIQHLPRKMKQNLIRRFKQQLSDSNSNKLYKNDLHLLNEVLGVINYMEQESNEKSFDHFKSITKRLDFLRSESFLQEFPEYAQVFSENESSETENN